MAAKLDKETLASTAKADDLTRRDFLLDKLQVSENIGAMDKAMKITANAIQKECAGEGIVEVKMWRIDDGGAITSRVAHVPRDAVRPNFLPIVSPEQVFLAQLLAPDNRAV